MPQLNSPKIIFLFTPGPIGGAEKIVAYGIKALINEGVHVEILLIREERVPHVAQEFIELLNQNQINYSLFSCHHIFDNILYKNLSASFKRKKADIVHAHGFKAAFYAKISLPNQTKLVITHHGKTSHTFKVKIYEYLEKLIMKRASAVMAVSQTMRTGLINEGIKEENIYVVENFMTEPLKIKNEYHSGPLKLLYVGRISPEKGCSLLIEAMTKVDRNKYKLLILGEGPEKKVLASRVNQLKLNDYVKFIGFKKDVMSYMAQSHAIVMPSLREGQPLTLIEACCMGLPVVASRVGGIPELVIDNQNGLLFKAGNSEELAKALNKLHHNYHWPKMNAEKNAPLFINRFSEKNWAIKTRSIYGRVLSQ